MKVGIDLRFLSNPDFVMRGVGRYISSLLSSMLDSKADIEFLILPPPNFKEILPRRITEDSKVFFDKPRLLTPRSKSGVVQQLVQFPLSIFERQVDLWHFPLSEIAPPWLNRPYILTIYDLYPYCQEAKPKSRIELIFASLLHRTVKNSRQIIAISNFTKANLIDHFGYSRNRVSTVYLGVDRSKFFPESSSIACQWVAENYSISDPYFLYVGGYDPRKNIYTLLDVYAHIKAKHRIPHKLVLAGRMTKDCIPLFQHVAELRLFKDVIFLDFVPDEALRYLYSGAEAFLFPSTFEGFGIPLLEALACHTKVIAFDNTSIPEVVDRTVQLIKSGDFVEFEQRILDVAILQRRNSEGDIKSIEDHLQKFTWSKAAEQTIHLYELVARS
jgi:glycosyltransferase involved in cell wall biosynthesis